LTLKGMIQVLLEEGDDAAPRVEGRWLVIGAAFDDAQDFEDDRNAIAGSLMIVHEGVPCVWVFLHVVRNRNRSEHAFEARRIAAIASIFRAIARDHRA
jgi:hypothetical protein